MDGLVGILIVDVGKERGRIDAYVCARLETITRVGGQPGPDNYIPSSVKLNEASQLSNHPLAPLCTCAF